MPTFCIQCGMKALLEDKEHVCIDEEPDEHARLMHPDPVAAWTERVELEKQLEKKAREKHVES